MQTMNKRDPAFIVWCGLAVLGAAVLEGVAVWAVLKVMKVAGSMGLFAWFFPVVLVPGMLAAELARLRRTKSRRMWLLSLKYYTVYLPLVGVFVAACQFRGPGLV